MPLFEIEKKCNKTKGRTGILSLPHGTVETPNFMGIATTASVKSLTTQDLEKIGSQIILSNTYHLWRRPGLEILQEAGGLHQFMGWDKPLFTDSGGFQAFSLGQNVRFSEDGIRFNDPTSGQKLHLTPEKSMQIQSIIGSDVALILDEISMGEEKDSAQKAMERTIRWSKRAITEWEKLHPDEKKDGTTALLFGIPQGMGDMELRRISAEMTMELDFGGYSIGGIAPQHNTMEMGLAEVDVQTDILEEEKPKHLLGIGTPQELVKFSALGIDLFDCVYPTRNARHGSIMFEIDENSYQMVQITSKRFEFDFSPINPSSVLWELRNYSKAYLRHLLRSKELLGYRLATLQNLEFYLNLMTTIREKIEDDSFGKWSERYGRVK